ncbi:hypothetical protein GCM10009119_13540 [Algoriphagus jejuensis]|uniref:Uncharacterized protein n=1 Tax=Algoriphagus jejuensis TaxID=419934 RepID=A0ABP3YA89_9BACT
MVEKTEDERLKINMYLMRKLRKSTRQLSGSLIVNMTIQNLATSQIKFLIHLDKLGDRKDLI